MIIVRKVGRNKMSHISVAVQIETICKWKLDRILDSDFSTDVS